MPDNFHRLQGIMLKISRIELMKLQQECGTDAAIARKLGIKAFSVYRIRKSLNISRISFNNADENNKILASYLKGLQPAALAKKYAMTEARIRRIVRAAGLERVRLIRPVR